MILTAGVGHAPSGRVTARGLDRRIKCAFKQGSLQVPMEVGGCGPPSPAPLGAGSSENESNFLNSIA